jgi:uncharacterized protein (DUF697 family)
MTDTVTDTVPGAVTAEAAVTHAPEAAPAHAPAAEMAAPDAAGAAGDENQEAIDKALDANDAIKNHVIASMAVGLVPIPGVDLAGTLAVQVRMVHQICGIYDVTLRDNAATTVVLALVGSLMPVVLAGGLVSGLKVIPGLGSLSGAAGVSLLGGAMTYAIGSVFQQHLESHDSLIDFDPTKVRSVMRREFDSGLTVARTLRGKVTDAIIAKEKAKDAASEPANAEAAETAEANPASDAAKSGPSVMRREFDAGVSAIRSLGDRATRVFKKSPAVSPAAETAMAADAAPATAAHAEAAHTAPQAAAAA